jgi:hypothetical protein
MTPGEAIQPLKRLIVEIEKDKKVKIDFGIKNSFCIESEPFKFVAARKNGISK